VPATIVLKWIIQLIAVSVFYNTLAFAGSGKLFSVTANGMFLPETVNFTLCLNANGQHPLSCQPYSTSQTNLAIGTTIPQHIYTAAGIKVLTPGYIYIPQDAQMSRRDMGSVGYIALDVLSDSVYASGIIIPANTASQTSTTLVSSSNPIVTSNSVSLTAIVNAANGAKAYGTMSFTESGAPIAGCGNVAVVSGSAICTTAFSRTGSYSIIATYNGAAGFASSTSVPFTQNVTSTTASIHTVPAFPRNVIAIPGNAQVSMNWLPPANTGGQVITGYTVTYGLTSGTTFTSHGCSTTGALSCDVSRLMNAQSYTFVVTATNATGTGPAAFSSPVTPQAGLTVSPELLGVSVNQHDTSAALTGHSRTITITNNSANEVTIANTPTTDDFSPVLPSGTTLASTTCTTNATLAANGGFCTLTIAPGATVSYSNASVLCTAGTVPELSRLNLMTSAGAVEVQVVVLGYGCQYQDGYVYSVNDTTPINSSIGGAVATLNDQGSSIAWDNNINGNGIWGIDDASTVSAPSPANVSLLTGQLNCDAVNDGACATNNIITYYPLPNSVAVGLCKAPISGHVDWYLPAVCELGPFGSSGVNVQPYPRLSKSKACIINSTNMQNQLAASRIVTNFTPGLYWSATEYSVNATKYAWYQNISVGSIGLQNFDLKSDTLRVRCARSLTL